MARIRSIKPEFWTDGKVSRLSDSSALLFIALWNYADDFGFFSCDTRELALRVPRWRSQSLFRMLCSLAEHGLIKLCSPLGVGLIVGWDHQKIKDRRASKWNDMEIKWDAITIDAQTSDRKPLGEDRIGKDRIGEDILTHKPNEAPQSGGNKRKQNETNGARRNKPENHSGGQAAPEVPSLSSQVWSAYSEEYAKRYHTQPVRNAKVNGQIARLVSRLGHEAPEVVRFFVKHPDRFYVSKLHDIGLCLVNAEALRTQWFHDKPITERDVKRYSDGQSQAELQQLIAEGKI